MLPKTTLSELLLFLAEHEDFHSIESLGSFTSAQVREALKDLAFSLRKQASEEQSSAKIDFKHFEELSPKVKQVLSTLTPRECQTLFQHFGFEK